MLPPLSQERRLLETRGLHRAIRTVDPLEGARARIDGREVILFCSNNYLGLSRHPDLTSRATTALHTYGCSTAASALISGHLEPHAAAESRMAEFLRVEAALSFPTGYMANLGAIAALVGKGDIVFSDSLNHRSIIDACRLSRAEVRVYRHRDMAHLAGMLKEAKARRRRLVVSDGLFSMDGDLAPLPDLAGLAEDHDAILMVDDAHATGVLGPTGRGTLEHFGLTKGIDVWMTAGSKGLGTYGGFIAGTGDLIDHLRNRAASYIYTTSLPPEQCAATCAALDLISRDSSPRESLWEHVQTVREGLLARGFDLMGSRTQIIPVRVGDASRATEISRFLFERGIYLYGIRPPTVPEGTARLRLSLMADHCDEDIHRLLDAMAEVASVFF